MCKLLNIKFSFYMSSSIIFTNFKLSANNININTNETTTIKGANLKAEDTLAINSKNLNIESVQNRQKSRDKSNGFSVGFGASGLQSLGVNKSSGSLDSKETLLTDLRGNSVNITTQEQTKLRGATIAAVDSQGNDNSQLALNTDTFLASSLNNRVDSKSKSLSINIGGNVEENTLNNVALDYSNDKSNQKTKTLATLGTGTINITNTDDSELKMLNRDIQDNEVDIYNIQSHKGLKTEIDTRMLTEDGRNQIARDYKVSTILVDSVSDIVQNDDMGVSDYFFHTEKSYKMLEGINKKILTDKELSQALSNPDLNPQQKQQMYKEVINAVAIELGYTKPQTLLVSTDVAGKDNEQVKGHYNNGTIYLNDKNILSTEDGIKTAGHEIMHIDSTTTEAYANLMGNKLADYTQFGLNNYYTDTSLANTNTKKEPQSALEYIQLQKNNDKFAVLDKSEGKNAIYLYKSRVVATDGVNDKKVIDLTDKEVFTQMMYNSYRKDEIKYIDQQDTSKFENVYYLDNKDDFEILRAATEQTYIDISPNTKIVFQNGMNTDQASMNQNLNLFKQDFTNVGGIHNDSGEYGIISDIFEWKPNYLTTKDVLNAEMLQRLSPNTIVVTHSAGNEDYYKAQQVNSLVKATTPIQNISVASPKSKTELDKINQEVGAKTITQINYPNDPVANGWLNGDADYEFKSVFDIKLHHPIKEYYPKVRKEIEAISNGN